MKPQGLPQVEEYTKAYSDSYFKLSNAISEMDAELEAVKNKYQPKFQKIIAEVRAKGEILKEVIELNADCFEKPKTQVYHSIKVGYTKGMDKLDFDDASTVNLIKKHLPESANILIAVKETAAKGALKQLDDKVLKKIGVERIEGVDEIIIKSTVQTGVEKVINSL